MKRVRYLVSITCGVLLLMLLLVSVRIHQSTPLLISPTPASYESSSLLHAKPRDFNKSPLVEHPVPHPFERHPDLDWGSSVEKWGQDKVIEWGQNEIPIALKSISKRLAAKTSHIRNPEHSMLKKQGMVVNRPSRSFGLPGETAAKASREQLRNRAIGSQVRSKGEVNNLGKSLTQQTNRSILSSSGRSLSVAGTRLSSKAMTSKVLQKSAGRIALLISLAVDAKYVFDTESAYRSGTISLRQRNIELASIAGGMGGAFAGASAGAGAGIWIGGLGGPFAWITVPVGGFLGSVIGGIGGYYGGSTAASYGATSWYGSIDASVRNDFEITWLRATGDGR